jgi:hypothetical protein
MLIRGLSQSALFSRNDHSVIESEVRNNFIEPQYIAKAFADHIASIFKSFSSVHILINFFFYSSACF